ncbi:MAG: DNA-binding response regulator [unclassified Hahellaceae]|nr:DNA-binding response regulator [Hahellaceae bacterium]
MRLLLVEDDLMLARTTCRNLMAGGFVVDQVGSAQSALQLGLQEDYKVAVVDIGLPDGNGLDVLRRWREAGKRLPVLLLTARGDWQDKVNGLKAGADDYLAKPFHIEELLARLHALVRRSEGRAENRLSAGKFILDGDRQQVQTTDGWQVLTATEFRLLRALMSRPGWVISKHELLEQLYDLDTEASANTIEAYVHRLRAIVGKSSILTMRGQGYCFKPDD